MLFSEGERRELADSLPSAFPMTLYGACWLVRQASKREATSDPTDAWADLITTTQNRRRLPNLAIVASKTDQTDQNLQAVCNLLGARARIVRNRVVTGLAAASIALGFGIAGWSMGTPRRACSHRRGSQRPRPCRGRRRLQTPLRSRR